MPPFERKTNRARIGTIATFNPVGSLAEARAFSTEAATAGQRAQAFDSFSGQAFALGAAKRQEQAQEEAMATPLQRAAVEYEVFDGNSPRTLRDEQGLVAPELPSRNSISIFDNTYRSAMTDRFVNELDIQAGQKLTELAIEYKDDPEGFATISESYRAAVAESVPREMRGHVELGINRKIGGHMNSLLHNKAAVDYAEAQSTWQTSVESKARDFVIAMAAKGTDLIVTSGAGGDSRVMQDPELMGMAAELQSSLARGIEAKYITPAEAVETVRNVSAKFGAAQLLNRIEGMGAGRANELEQQKLIHEVVKGDAKVVTPTMTEDGEIIMEENRLDAIFTPEQITTMSGQLSRMSNDMNKLRVAKEQLQNYYVGQSISSLVASTYLSFQNGGELPSHAEIAKLSQRYASNPKMQASFMRQMSGILAANDARTMKEIAATTAAAEVERLQDWLSQANPTLVQQVMGGENLSHANVLNNDDPLALRSQISIYSRRVRMVQSLEKGLSAQNNAVAKLRSHQAYGVDAKNPPSQLLQDTANIDMSYLTGTPTDELAGVQGREWFVKNAAKLENYLTTTNVIPSAVSNAIAGIVNDVQNATPEQRNAAIDMARTLMDNPATQMHARTQLGQTVAQQVDYIQQNALSSGDDFLNAQVQKDLAAIRRGEEPSFTEAALERADLEAIGRIVDRRYEDSHISPEFRQSAIEYVARTVPPGRLKGLIFGLFGDIGRARDALAEFDSRSEYGPTTIMLAADGFSHIGQKRGENKMGIFTSEQWHSRFPPDRVYPELSQTDIIRSTEDFLMNGGISKEALKKTYGDARPVMGENTFLKWAFEKADMTTGVPIHHWSVWVKKTGFEHEQPLYESNGRQVIVDFHEEGVEAARKKLEAEQKPLKEYQDLRQAMGKAGTDTDPRPIWRLQDQGTDFEGLRFDFPGSKGIFEELVRQRAAEEDERQEALDEIRRAGGHR